MSETAKTADQQVRMESEGNWRLQVRSYRLADKYICLVDNVDPGARLASAEGSTREEAEQAALEKARQMVRETRTFQ